MSGFFPAGGGGSGGLTSQTQSVSGAPQNAITFSGIPSSARHLLFIGDCGTNRAGQAGGFISMQFNGDTAAHYYMEQGPQAQNAVLAGANSNANTSQVIQTTGALGPANELLNPFTVWVLDIQNLTSNKKLFLQYARDTTPPTATENWFISGWWQPTVLATPITSVTFDANFAGSGQLIVGSSISMYQFQ